MNLRHFSLSSRTLTLLFAGAAITASGGRAHACGYTCPIAVQTPTGPVPANALVFPAHDQSVQVQLAGSDGPVKTSVKPDGRDGFVFTPDAPTPVGHYRLTYVSGCAGVPSSTQEVAFDVVEPASYPSKL